MESRRLRDLEVSAIGYGCMGLSMGYGPAPAKDDAIATIQKVYDLGCTFFDTAEIYAIGANEELVGEALKSVRKNVVLATKFLIQDEHEINSRSQLFSDIRKRLENSLRRLGTDHVDIYYQHRVNKNIPVEDIARCMGELIREGKILGWGQSQATEEEIRKAHAITPLTAIQSEFSIMERGFEKDIIPTCEELNIGFVPFSPLGNGFLSGKINADSTFTGFDARRVITRFEKNNLLANQPVLDLLNQLAEEKKATPAQVSLAWILHKKDFIVPIPGSKNISRMEENLGASKVVLTDAEYSTIEKELSEIRIHGNRRDEDLAKLRMLMD